MVKLFQALLDKSDLFTAIYFDDSLVVNLTLHLLHSILVCNNFFLDPFGIVGNQSGDQESERNKNVFNHEDSDDEVGPGP